VFWTLIIIGGDSGTRWADYYPLKPGYKWTYKTTTTFNGENIRGDNGSLVAIGKVERDNKEWFLLKGESASHILPNRSLRITTNRGVEVYQDDEFVYGKDEPRLLLKFPLRKGKEWETRIGNDKIKLTVEKDEAVEIPAGKFRAFKIVGARGNTNFALWYTKNIGLVRYTVTQNDNGRNFSRVMELVKFDRGDNKK